MKTCRSVERMTTLTMSSIPLTASSATDSTNERDKPESDDRQTEPRDGNEQRPTGATHWRTVRQHQRHRDRARRRCRLQDAETLRTHVQDLAGEDRQERHRATEQHREQVQRHGAEQHRLMQHEPNADAEAFPDRVSSAVNASTTRSTRVRQSSAMRKSDVPTPYASRALPNAYSSPPIAGPSTAANCQAALRHAAARG